MKKEREKSDPSIVAKRPANKPKVSEVDLWACGAEPVEPREGTEGNTGEQHTCRTPSRASVSQGLERVPEAAKQRKKERFTALRIAIYFNPRCLFSLRQHVVATMACLSPCGAVFAQQQASRRNRQRKQVWPKTT